MTIAAALTAYGAYAQNDSDMNGKKTLVAYFSATGTTEKVAGMIAEISGGYLYEITPLEPYTAADLDWHDSNSRSSVEMKDDKSRPAIENDLKDAESYDVIYLGYPVWWGLAPRAVNTFLDTYGFAGKTVIPFATSGGSGISNSEAKLREQYPDIRWKSGRLLNSPSKSAIKGMAGIDSSHFFSPFRKACPSLY